MFAVAAIICDDYRWNVMRTLSKRTLRSILRLSPQSQHTHHIGCARRTPIIRLDLSAIYVVVARCRDDNRFEQRRTYRHRTCTRIFHLRAHRKCTSSDGASSRRRRVKRLIDNTRKLPVPRPNMVGNRMRLLAIDRCVHYSDKETSKL